jgi:lipopolysaccharide/colanic/teichoic acid biosynthesis glycosyltransferase
MTSERQGGTVRDLAGWWRRLVERLCPPAVCVQPGLYSVEQFHAALERERARAERNGHRITLVLIQTNNQDLTRSGQPRLTDVLKGRLRVMDEAGWFDRSRLGVLMPYTTCEGAWHLVDDLCRLMDGELFRSDCRVYMYPHDGFPGNGQRDGHDAAEIPASQPVGSLYESPLAVAFHSEGGNGFGSCGDSTCSHASGSDAATCCHPLEPGPWNHLSVGQRGLDIIGSLLGLVVLSPVFLAAAVLIKLVSPGPVFFKQLRIGQGGKPFLLWKLRTMTANADPSIHEDHVARLIRSANNNKAAQPMVKLDNDPRVIPFGRILRGTCIDELPQLINVLRGEMSLVGPRPPIPYEVREYLPWQKRRLDVTPGLTGLWQVSGKSRLSFDQMVRLDIRYCRTRSLWGAVAILCRTPRAIVQEIAGTRVRWKL